MLALRILRNSNILANREAALAAIQAKVSELADGEVFIVSYTITDGVASIITVKREGGYTSFDVEGIGNEIDEKIEEAIAALDLSIDDVNANASDGKYVSTAISQTDGVVKNESVSVTYGDYDTPADGIATVEDTIEYVGDVIAALDVTKGSTTVEEGKHVAVQVVEVDGLLDSVTVTEEDIASAALLGETTDGKENATAFGYIAKEAYDRQEAIDTLDNSLAAVAKSGSADDVATEDLPASENNVAITGATVPAQIEDIATILKTMQDGVINYKVKQLTAAEIALLPDAVNVKEAYKVVSYVGEEMYVKVNPAEEIISPITTTEYEALTPEQKIKYKLDDTQYTQVGDTIKIYKDSALDKFYLGHVDDFLTNADAQGESEDDAITDGTGSEALVYVQQLANGKYKLVAVDVESFLMEAEFKDGLEVDSSNHEVSVKIDPSSDPALSVSADGLKLTLPALPSNNPESSDDTNVQVKVTQVDGKVTAVNVTTDNTVNATDVSDAIAATGISAAGDDYISASVDANNNKKINVAADVQTLTVNSATGSGTTTLTGTAESLVDGGDVATKVTSFVNARIDEEIAKLDETKRGNLDSSDNLESGKLVGVKVVEVDGKLDSVTVVESTVWDCGEY